MAERCTATSKSTGVQCRQPACEGNTKCRYHGGKNLRGIASPSYIHGRYSKYLPERLREQYEEAQQDPELLALKDEISLLRIRTEELMARIDGNDSAARWDLLKKQFQNLQRARFSTDAEKFKQAIADLEETIMESGPDHAIWAEIMALVEGRRKLVESERKRLVEMSQLITTEQAMGMLALILDTIRRHVTDQRVLSAISTDIDTYVVNRAGPVAIAGQ